MGPIRKLMDGKMWCRPGMDHFGGADVVTVQRLIAAPVCGRSRSSTVCMGLCWYVVTHHGLCFPGFLD